MDFTTLASMRYSVRSFAPTPVPDADLEAVLEAGRLAPTAKNFQPQRIYCLQSADALKKANECSPCIYGATTVLVVCIDKNECWNASDGSRSSDDVDASIVATHLMLKATELGLGTCMVLLFDPDKFRTLFALPEGVKPVCFLPIGYPGADCAPAPRHTSRKSIADTTVML